VNILYLSARKVLAALCTPLGFFTLYSNLRQNQNTHRILLVLLAAFLLFSLETNSAANFWEAGQAFEGAFF